MLNFGDAPIRALIVFNPGAGQAGSAEQDIYAARDVWREHGWQVDLCPTAGPGDGTRIAREAVEQGYHMVVAAGGDGTVNEVINGLAGSQTVLAALPIGTVNVWVRELGLPLQPRAAASRAIRVPSPGPAVGRSSTCQPCSRQTSRAAWISCSAEPAWPAPGLNTISARIGASAKFSMAQSIP